MDLVGGLGNSLISSSSADLGIGGGGGLSNSYGSGLNVGGVSSGTIIILSMKFDTIFALLRNNNFI